MKLVATSTTLSVTPAQAQRDVVVLRGLPAGTICKGLWLELNATITRASGDGAATIVHPPEQLSQIFKAMTLKTPQTAAKSFIPDINGIDGSVFEYFWRNNIGYRNNMNKQLAADATSFQQFLFIPWVPNLPNLLLKPSRPLSEWLEGMSLSYTLSLADFSTADIVSGSFFVRVYAVCESKPAGYAPTAGGIVVRQVADFESNDKQYITTYQPTHMFLRTRSTFNQLTLSSGSPYYENLTPLEIEQYFPDQRAYLHNETRTTFQGDPMSNLIPLMDGGSSTTFTGLVAFDVRNMKDLAAPIELRAFSKSGAIPFDVFGWQQQ